jgi:branched-chain amino acid transport system ATP-binding protein
MLEIAGLTKKFGGLCAVNELTFTVDQGEIVGLIGPNGAGKTTVFNLITGYLHPTDGKITFETKDISGKSPSSIAARGVVRTFQATSVFPEFSVTDNIAVACHVKDRMRLGEALLHTPGSRRKEKRIAQKAAEIIETVGLSEARDVLAKNLPHGHKRRLGIAIALATQPRLLLLDEPLTGMNAEEVADALGLIKRLWRDGITILLIEHNMKAAMSLCQRLVVLNFGTRLAEGTPAEIRGNPEVIKAYLGADGDAA